MDGNSRKNVNELEGQGMADDPIPRSWVLLSTAGPSRTIVTRERQDVCLLSCGHRIVLWVGFEHARIVHCPQCVKE